MIRGLVIGSLIGLVAAVGVSAIGGINAEALITFGIPLTFMGGIFGAIVGFARSKGSK